MTACCGGPAGRLGAIEHPVPHPFQQSVTRLCKAMLEKWSACCSTFGARAGFLVDWNNGHHTWRPMSSLPNPLITSSEERLGGTPVFAGTRVPVQSLIDYLEGGDSLDVFVDQFPSVSREHAVAVLELAKRALIAPTAA